MRKVLSLVKHTSFLCPRNMFAGMTTTGLFANRCRENLETSRTWEQLLIGARELCQQLLDTIHRASNATFFGAEGVASLMLHSNLFSTTISFPSATRRHRPFRQMQIFFEHHFYRPRSFLSLKFHTVFPGQ